MLDLPAGGQLESIEDFVSFAMAEGNPLKLTLQRLQLQTFLAKVPHRRHVCALVVTVHLLSCYILTAIDSLSGVFPC